MKSTANARDNDGGAAAEWVAVDELRPWPENPRLNDGEPVKRVMASIERFGFAAPIVARRSDNTIIAGHTRWKAAQALGLARVPVRFVDLSANEARLLALADNRYTELTEWDEVALQSILSDIGLTDAAFVGWSSADVDAMADEIETRRAALVAEAESRLARFQAAETALRERCRALARGAADEVVADERGLG